MIDNGSLTSLDMTVNGNFAVAGVTITATNLEFQYTVTSTGSTFAMAGTASVAVNNLGSFSVTFGHGATPGLVIVDGSLTSLDMTVNGNFAVAGVTITATNLEFQYTVTSTGSTFAMLGTAGVAINKLGTIAVTFGHGATPGLVITNGALSSLNMTVNASFTVASVTINATNLEFQYTVSSTGNRFAMLGTASVAIARLGNLGVTFGNASSPGMVIVNGTLQSLNMTVNSSFTVGSVNFSTTD